MWDEACLIGWVEVFLRNAGLLPWPLGVKGVTLPLGQSGSKTWYKHQPGRGVGDTSLCIGVAVWGRLKIYV